MATKMDQGLDSIISANRAGKRAQNRRARKGKTTATPVGGVTKPKPTKKDKKTAAGPSAKGTSQIMVSNLPLDVTETLVKEYFEKTIGPIKKVILNYGPNGASRGVANVIFSQADAASKAVTQLNGLKVDGRPMKIDIIVLGKDAPALPEPKTLADRVSQPKSAAAKPKPATGTKAAKVAGTTATRGGRKGRAARKGRPKKTLEQLDAEMHDYFQPGTEGAPTAAATTAAPANGDLNMDDEVL